ncbi:MAG: DUF1266 domain-containing protein, partial [Lactobacillus sp.]|nr:DUF1266 domain-containing protein [Lactobacillus sp.]
IEKEDNFGEEELWSLSFGAPFDIARHDTTRSIRSIYKKRFHIDTLSKIWGVDNADDLKRKYDMYLDENIMKEYDSDFIELRGYRNFEALKTVNRPILKKYGEGYCKNFYKVKDKIMKIIKEDYPKDYFDEVSFENVKTLIAWPYAKAGNAVKLAYNAEYIDEDTAWDMLDEIGERASKKYRDWHEYGIASIYGRFLMHTQDIDSWVGYIVDELWDYDETVWGEVDI